MKKISRYLLLMLPSFGAIYWSVAPAAKTYASMLFVNISNLNDKATRTLRTKTVVQRNIQAAFLRQGVYIPLEDIFVRSPAPSAEEDRLYLLMKKFCGRGTVFVWIPLRFRVPFSGNIITEMCWKPNIPLSLAKS